jgi:hypothetical protein
LAITSPSFAYSSAGLFNEYIRGYVLNIRSATDIQRAWLARARDKVGPKPMRINVLRKNTASSIGRVPMTMPVGWAGSIVHVPEEMAIESAADI